MFSPLNPVISDGNERTPERRISLGFRWELDLVYERVVGWRRPPKHRRVTLTNGIVEHPVCQNPA